MELYFNRVVPESFNEDGSTSEAYIDVATRPLTPCVVGVVKTTGEWVSEVSQDDDDDDYADKILKSLKRKELTVSRSSEIKLLTGHFSMHIYEKREVDAIIEFLQEARKYLD